MYGTLRLQFDVALEKELMHYSASQSKTCHGCFTLYYFTLINSDMCWYLFCCIIVWCGCNHRLCYLETIIIPQPHTHIKYVYEFIGSVCRSWWLLLNNTTCCCNRWVFFMQQPYIFIYAIWNVYVSHPMLMTLVLPLYRLYCTIYLYCLYCLSAFTAVTLYPMPLLHYIYCLYCLSAFTAVTLDVPVIASVI